MPSLFILHALVNYYKMIPGFSAACFCLGMSHKTVFQIKRRIDMTTNENALMLHEKWNGKLETVSKTPVKSREDLALAYTPGVAEPCKVIARD